MKMDESVCFHIQCCEFSFELCPSSELAQFEMLVVVVVVVVMVMSVVLCHRVQAPGRPRCRWLCVVMMVLVLVVLLVVVLLLLLLLLLLLFLVLPVLHRFGPLAS